MTNAADKKNFAALKACRILDTGPEPAFDAIVQRAARAAKTPFALLALHDEGRLWFKASFGAKAQEAPSADPIAHDALHAKGLLWISDVQRHPRYAQSQWAANAPHIRFFAGAPLRVSTGEAVGMLCVIGLAPRRRSRRLIAELEELALIAEALIEARRQTALREESDRLRALAESEAGVGFWRIDRAAEEGWWSPGVYSLFGRDPALGPMQPQDYKAIVPAGSWPDWKEFIRRATSTGESFTLRLPLRRPDGEIRKLKIVCGADAGASDISLGIAVDETVLSNALERVTANKKMLSSFIEGAPAALAMFDRDMRYLRASPQWRLDYDLGDEDLVGRSHYDVFPEIGDEWKAVHKRCLAGAIERCEREQFVRADGSVQYLAWEVRPWRDEDGEIGGLIMLTRDLTREVEALIALERTHERLKQALDIGHAYMWEYDDAQGRVFFDGDPKAVMGIDLPTTTKPMDVFTIVHRDDRAEAVALWKAHVKAFTPYRIEQRAATIDGTERWMLAVSEAKRDASGRVIGAVGLVQDITARKRGQLELAAARDAAEAANRSKSEFLANVGHELRTPLHGVLGMAHALLRSTVSTQQHELLGVIIESGDTVLALLNDLLDSARIEAGQLSLSIAPFKVDDVLRSVAAINRERASAKGLTLEAESGAFDCSYLGDALRVKQVLLNLVGNAVKFTESGGVRISVSRQGASGGVERILFRVADTGPGFDAGTRARLFQRFAQADGQTTQRFGGFGLGLAISRGLVDLMGGEIDCASTPGGGSEFWFAVPLPRVGENATAPARPTISEALGLRVLCAEDHPVNRKVVDLLLGNFGCSTSFVENGAEAVAAWETGAFDVILMDLHMPVMGGETAAAHIRAREIASRRARTPIIAITAHATTERVAASGAAGMDGHIAKPFRPEDLLAAIRDALRVNAERKAGRNAELGAAADKAS